MQPADALDLSPEAALRDMIEQVSLRVPGCCGASSARWAGGSLTAGVSSHPDLATLMSAEASLPDSPLQTAARTERPVRVEDTLRDVLWRPFSARALDLGVRCLVCVPQRTGEGVITNLTLYSLRPRGLPEQAVQLATGLLAEWTTTLAAGNAFADVQAEAHQLNEAIAARELVEQAKGMLMHALGCDAERAYQELAGAAERSRLRITDVARRMVEHRSTRPAGDDRSRRARPRQSVS